MLKTYINEFKKKCNLSFVRYPVSRSDVTNTASNSHKQPPSPANSSIMHMGMVCKDQKISFYLRPKLQILRPLSVSTFFVSIFLVFNHFVLVGPL